MTRRLLAAIAAVYALGLAVPANAGVMFDPTGGGCAIVCYEIDVLDPSTGNSISIGLSAQSSAGDVGTLLYQADLAIARLGNTQVYANGDDGAYFTIAASFDEELTAIAQIGSSTFLEFGFDGADATDGVFRIYYQPGGEGDDLAGTCFVESCGGIMVLEGTFINDVDFFGTFTINGNAGIDPLDSTANGDQYPGLDSVNGLGAFGANILVTDVDANFFPDLFVGSTFLFVTTEQNLPYTTVDPAACFSSDAITDCDTDGATLASIGSINGLDGPNTMLQTDASITLFPGAEVPEPATLTLLGLGLLGSAAARRRMRKTQG